MSMREWIQDHQKMMLADSDLLWHNNNNSN